MFMRKLILQTKPGWVEYLGVELREGCISNAPSAGPRVGHDGDDLHRGVRSRAGPVYTPRGLFN